jgi:nickel superoxide dismutase
MYCIKKNNAAHKGAQTPLTAKAAEIAKRLGIGFALAGLTMVPIALPAHCQVPCGIYDDHARVMAMAEDAETVIKAVTMMNELAGKHDVQASQQFIRWVNNKEQHAQKIISTMADYFLTQRVKTSQSDYTARLAKHHAVILAAMKAKQQSNLAVAQELFDAIKSLEAYYPHEHQH